MYRKINSSIKSGKTSSIYNELLKLAKSKGLTLRPSNGSGNTPMKFELMYRIILKGDSCIIGDLLASSTSSEMPKPI